MLPPLDLLRARLRAVIADRAEQGHDVHGVDLDAVADSYDALAEFASVVAALPMRADWPYVEPDTLEEIRAEATFPAPLGPVPADAPARIEEAFLARVAGCILGKPFEFDPTMDELRAALEPVGEWPLREYLSERGLERLREKQGQWPELVRERIAHVAPDDDINYTIIAMLGLEEHGAQFTQEDLRRIWSFQLPLVAVFGPERTLLASLGAHALEPGAPLDDAWRFRWNPADEHCGALIRADAYGYACIGDPARAAELAFRDASMTHRRTGVYATMFVAAAIAAAPYTPDPFSIALDVVPRRSRFAEVVRASIEIVNDAVAFEDAYRKIHERFSSYTHCRVTQEIGTLVNTFRFARDPGDGICLQVMQGNDTDSFGATVGSLLGMKFGPGTLDRRWIEPFNDEIRFALATFYERSLSAVARRMGALPRRTR